MERVKLRSGTVGTDAMCNCTWTLASRSFEKGRNGVPTYILAIYLGKD